MAPVLQPGLIIQTIWVMIIWITFVWTMGLTWTYLRICSQESGCDHESFQAEYFPIKNITW